MKLFDLDGKICVVTGSSRGIGRAIAKAAAQAGAKVVISSRKQDACDLVANEINADLGEGRAVAIAASISSKSDLQHLVDETRRVFGKIDVLVCNAASNPHYGPLASITDETFVKLFNNNVLSNHWLIGMVAPEMIERKDGSIIVISSVGGSLGSSAIGAYNITKAADLQLVRNLAVEFGPHNVRINAISPGIIKTDFAKPLYESKDASEAIERVTPLRRAGEPAEIGGAAVFLASAAGSYMTGQSLVIDGGRTINGDS
ncbi:SDR family NAD(P)-dependent oxidoreductase [Novosphingobium sp. 9U]|uniref:SDR family NAD(P)-dependent oxidoreductase n=1 Tax=Novosphingobium sp. 9U TaxID=2653158 RepID=UPI0012F29A17|nr:glucose 1-dehydrogenase [Novosphingobium sp. 9U]VWX50600.1 Short-chain dehydrogenase [Novosphingobium sp. 9U]